MHFLGFVRFRLKKGGRDLACNIFFLAKIVCSMEILINLENSRFCSHKFWAKQGQCFFFSRETFRFAREIFRKSARDFGKVPVTKNPEFCP